jgi:hydrogenase nickel incorporation protein HypB
MFRKGFNPSLRDGRPSSRGDSEGRGQLKIDVMTDVLAANDRIAAANREIFERSCVTVINLMSSPGAGKTMLIEKTAEALAGKLRLGVIVGDIETDQDAARISKQGIPAVQLTTGSACHLDANMVASALSELDLGMIDVLLIENVGNLVCPAEFAVGEDYKVMILSVTEGDEKPLKYPLMFKESSLLILNKVDLLPFTNFNVDAARSNALSRNPDLKILELSCTTGQGVEDWLAWLEERCQGGLESQRHA